MKHPGKKRSTQRAELRRQAEEHLKQQQPGAAPSLSGPETQALLHELKVHQVELELQNAELHRSRDEAESLLAQYTELYEFAPVGYFTLDRKGIILKANLSGARLLRVNRARLLGRNFGVFLTHSTRQIFGDFRHRVFAGQGKVCCEVALAMGGDDRCFLQVEVSGMADAVSKFALWGENRGLAIGEYGCVDVAVLTVIGEVKDQPGGVSTSGDHVGLLERRLL